jgi:hypothetical protein
MKFNKLACWLSLVFAASTCFAQTYTVVKLPGSLRPIQINNHGHVVGTTIAPVPGTSYFTSHAFYWTKKGGLLDLQPLISPNCGSTNFCGSEATGINDKDWVVGDGTGGVFLWTKASGAQFLRDARDPSFTGSSTGVNARGTVWGIYNSYLLSDYWAYLWTEAGGYTIVEQPRPPIYGFQALNDLDHLLLSVLTDNGQAETAAIWTKAGGFGPPLNIAGPDDYLYPGDLNNRDEIVGAGLPTDKGGFFLWSPVSGTQPIPWITGPLNGCGPRVNNLSQVAAGMGTGAIIWTASTGTQDLNTLVPLGLGTVLYCATDINDKGQILAYGFPVPGSYNTSEGYVLSPKMNVALTSSGNSLPYRSSITFLASVTSAQGFVPEKTERVVFKDGAKILGVRRLNQGLAGLTLSRLSVGTHAITAVYRGSENYAVSVSPLLMQVVK